MEICGCHLGLDLLFFFPLGLGHQAFYRYSFVSFNVGLGKSLFLKQVKEESWDWMCAPPPLVGSKLNTLMDVPWVP